MSKKFQVTLKKSIIGCSKSQIATVIAIGLKKINKSVVVEDNMANRGQLFKVQHLLDIKVIN